MGYSESRHQTPRHECTCQICGQVWLAKKPGAKYCPAEHCQRARVKLHQQRQYERIKQTPA